MAIEELKIIVKSEEKTIHKLIWDGDFEEWMLFGGEVVEFVDKYKKITIDIKKK